MNPPKGKRFKPMPHYGGWISLGLAIFSLIISLGLASQLNGLAVSGRLFWFMLGSLLFLALSLYLFYRTFALFQLSYLLSRNGLEIKWGLNKQKIPIEAIETIVAVADSPLKERSLWGLAIPPWWAGRWGKTAFYATAPAQQSLAVQTAAGAYIISPDDSQTFLSDWEVRLPLGPSQNWKQETVKHPLFAYPLWQDKLALRLGAGAILTALILLGATMSAYPSWPAAIPLPNSTTITTPNQLLIVPLMGLLILALNLSLGLLFYKKNPLLTYVLYAITILAQIGLWLAIRMIVG